MNQINSIAGCHELSAALGDALQPVLVLGYGAVLARAAAEVATLAQRLPQLRIVATPKAKGVFPETHAQYLGVIGFAGHSAADQCVFERADYVVIVGTRLGELSSNNWDARWQQLKSARIDICDVKTSWCGSGLFVQGDARWVLSQVNEHLSWCPKILPCERRRSLSTPVMAMTSMAPIQPKDVMQYVNAVFPAQGHVFSGIGNTMAWAVHYLRREAADRWHVNLCAGAMGHAIPAAIGAALSGACCIALVGDAEFLMTGYELHTAIENQLSVTVVVLNDAGHGMVRVGSSVHCNGQTPSFEFDMPVDIVTASRAQGAHAVRVVEHRTFVTELSASLSRPGPTVIDVPIAKDLIPPLGARLDSLSHAFGSGKAGLSHADQ